MTPGEPVPGLEVAGSTLVRTTVSGRILLPRSRRSFRSPREHGQAAHARNVLLSDIAVVSGAIYLAQLIIFGKIGDTTDLTWTTRPGIDYTAVSGALALLWLGLLTMVNSKAPRILGRGVEEYRRVFSATFAMFGVISMLALLLNMDFARDYLAIAFPLGLLALLLSRHAWRGVARRTRANGRFRSALLVVGTRQAAVEIAANFAGERELGYRIVGLCTPEGPTPERGTVAIAGTEIPIVGIDTAIIDAVKVTNADTVAISATDDLGPKETKRLVWDLEERGVDLIVTAGLIDAADNRISCHPVAGMAILYIEKPQYARANSWAKRAFDLCFALVALVGAAPVMLAAAIAVSVSSRGPLFYHAERIGMDGRVFKMVKFRSMYVGSDARLAGLIGERGGNALFFKLKKDPRVTPVGRWLRKLSIDELPQFFNVVRGEMSVVGPRPQVLGEVEAYDDLMGTRLFVRPGMTGLWQVSGRSNLSAEDSIRLDVSYVENWSMAMDLAIIVRTARVVLTGHGAY
jgi:exopolysaccharide biosynthesis polyprenyl glycosylphosphotransferase